MILSKKRIPTELFHLDKITDTPLFEGFAAAKARSLLGRESRDEDLNHYYEIPWSASQWEPARLAGTWKPLKAVGRVAPFNDFPMVDSYPAFSQRACDVLREFLEPNGELLPLKSDVGVPYFFFNVTTISNALDAKNSECNWLEEPTNAMNIDYFTFQQKKLAGLSIFRLYQLPNEVLVTDEFAERVRSSGLNGFRLRKVWPFDKGVTWWKEAKKTDQARNYGGTDIKRHTLVIILPLKERKPTKSEKKTIKQLEEELDAQLRVSSLDSPYFGSYEGSDIGDSGLRLFLSSPDAEKLLKKLHPWLLHLEWPKKPSIVKRFGSMFDENARQQPVKL